MNPPSHRPPKEFLRPESAAADRQKHELAADAGIAYSYRIPVEDVAAADDLSAHIDRFLKRVSER
jgi:hypothetical protein